MMTGTMITASATDPANALYCLNGSTRNVNDEDADEDRRDPDEDVGGEPDDGPRPTGPRARSRRSPAARPIGTAMSVARPTIWIEPVIAVTAPPPTPSAFGGFVRRSMFSAAIPLIVTNASTATSGMIAMTVQASVTARMPAIHDRPPLAPADTAQATRDRDAGAAASHPARRPSQT